MSLICRAAPQHALLVVLGRRRRTGREDQLRPIGDDVRRQLMPWSSMAASTASATVSRVDRARRGDPRRSPPGRGAAPPRTRWWPDGAHRGSCPPAPRPAGRAERTADRTGPSVVRRHPPPHSRPLASSRSTREAQRESPVRPLPHPARLQQSGGGVTDEDLARGRIGLELDRGRRARTRDHQLVVGRPDEEEPERSAVDPDRHAQPDGTGAGSDPSVGPDQPLHLRDDHRRPSPCSSPVKSTRIGRRRTSRCPHPLRTRRRSVV